MFHRDEAGIAAALAALLLSAGVWLLDGLSNAPPQANDRAATVQAGRQVFEYEPLGQAMLRRDTAVGITSAHFREGPGKRPPQVVEAAFDRWLIRLTSSSDQQVADTGG